MKRFLFLLRFIGLGALIYILSKLEYKELYEVLKSVDFVYILLYMVAFSIFFYFRLIRFKYILNHYGGFPKMFDLFGATVESQYLNFVMPSRVGDSVKILFLYDKSNIPKKITTLAYIYDKFQDLWFIAIVGSFAFFFVLNLPLDTYFIIFIIVITLMFVFRNFLLEKLSNKLHVNEFKKLNIKVDIILLLGNFAIYAVFFVQYYFVALALHVHVGFVYFTSVVILGILVSLLPISMAGIGVREGVFIYYLGLVGVSKENAFLVSFLDNAGLTIFIIISLHIIYKILSVYFEKREKNEKTE